MLGRVLHAEIQPCDTLGWIMLCNAVICLTWAVAVATAAGQPSLGGSKAGEVRENARDGEQYAWIPGGTFRMGCSQGDAECRGEQKLRTVTIAHGF